MPTHPSAHVQNTPMGTEDTMIWVFDPLGGEEATGEWQAYPPGEIALPTQRTHNETLGHLNRSMPIEELHKAYDVVLNMLDKNRVVPGNQPRAFYLEGPPSIGKTTLLYGFQNATGGTLTRIDCGGVQLGDLFTTMTFATRPGSLFEALDAYVADPGASHFSSGFREAMESLQLPERTNPNTNRQEVDWEAVAQHEPDYHQKIIQFFAMEVPTAGGMGMQKTDGKLMTTLKEILLNNTPGPHFIILDEFNRYRGNDFGPVTSLFEVVGGTRPSCTLTDAEGHTFTVTNADLKAHNIVFALTGNPQKPSDPEAKKLPDALASRIPQMRVPSYGPSAYQQRFEHALTGLWGSAIAQAADFVPEEKMAAYLFEQRTLGLTDEEALNVPRHQQAYLERWGDVSIASASIANILSAVEEMVDTKSAVYAVPARQPMLKEMNEWKKINPDALDLRFIERLVNQSLEIGSKKRKASAARDTQPTNRTAPIEEGFGDRLVETLQRELNAMFPAEEYPEANRYILLQLVKHGALPLNQLDEIKSQIALDEYNAISQDRQHNLTIAEQLNITDTRPLPPRVRNWHAIMLEYIARKYPDADIDAEALSPQAVLTALNNLPHALRVADGMHDASSPVMEGSLEHLYPDRAAVLPTLSVRIGHDRIIPHLQIAQATDPLALKGGVAEDFTRIAERDIKDSHTQTPEPMYMDGYEFLMALAIDHDMNQVLRNQLFNAYHAADASDSDFQINNGTHHTGLAYTPLYLGKTTQDQWASGVSRERMDVICYGVPPQPLQWLVVGDTSIPSELSHALNVAGVTYVQRSPENTIDLARGWLETVANGSGNHPELYTALQSAMNQRILPSMFTIASKSTGSLFQFEEDTLENLLIHAVEGDPTAKLSFTMAAALIPEVRAIQEPDDASRHAAQVAAIREFFKVNEDLALVFDETCTLPGYNDPNTERGKQLAFLTGAAYHLLNSVSDPEAQEKLPNYLALCAEQLSLTEIFDGIDDSLKTGISAQKPDGSTKTNYDIMDEVLDRIQRLEEALFTPHNLSPVAHAAFTRALYANEQRGKSLLALTPEEIMGMPHTNHALSPTHLYRTTGIEASANVPDYALTGRYDLLGPGHKQLPGA